MSKAEQTITYQYSLSSFKRFFPKSFLKTFVEYFKLHISIKFSICYLSTISLEVNKMLPFCTILPFIPEFLFQPLLKNKS